MRPPPEKAGSAGKGQEVAHGPGLLRPGTDESVKIAQALRVSVEYLVTGENPDNTALAEKIQSLARQILDETSKIK